MPEMRESAWCCCNMAAAWSRELAGRKVISENVAAACLAMWLTFTSGKIIFMKLL